MDSYTTASKEIVDTKITMRSSSLLTMTAIITAVVGATAKLSWNFA
jgi:hypothetical protein